MIENKKSFFRFCHAFCGEEVDVEDNRVLAVRGDPDNAVSQGYTCMRGRAEVERIYHSERLLSPKKLVNGQRVDIDAEQAMDEIAGKLEAIVSEHGPTSVAAFLGCGAHRASASGPWFVRRWFEAPVPVNLFDIANADVAMFVGTNRLVSHVMSMPQSNLSKRLKDAQKRGMKFIVLFDDVFIPNEHVFMDGEWEFSGDMEEKGR